MANRQFVLGGGGGGSLKEFHVLKPNTSHLSTFTIAPKFVWNESCAANCYRVRSENQIKFQELLKLLFPFVITLFHVVSLPLICLSMMCINSRVQCSYLISMVIVSQFLWFGKMGEIIWFTNHYPTKITLYKNYPLYSSSTGHAQTSIYVVMQRPETEAL